LLYLQGRRLAHFDPKGNKKHGRERYRGKEGESAPSDPYRQEVSSSSETHGEGKTRVTGGAAASGEKGSRSEKKVSCQKEGKSRPSFLFGRGGKAWGSEEEYLNTTRVYLWKRGKKQASLSRGEACLAGRGGGENPYLSF